MGWYCILLPFVDAKSAAIFFFAIVYLRVTSIITWCLRTLSSMMSFLFVYKMLGFVKYLRYFFISRRYFYLWLEKRYVFIKTLLLKVHCFPAFLLATSAHCCHRMMGFLHLSAKPLNIYLFSNVLVVPRDVFQSTSAASHPNCCLHWCF